MTESEKVQWGIHYKEVPLYIRSRNCAPCWLCNT